MAYLPQVVIDSLRVATGASTDVAVSPSGGDDTVAIQSALTLAASYGVASAGCGRVVLNAGTYHISSTLNWGDCSLVGEHSNSGVRVLWNGPAGIAIHKTGQLSFGRLSGINFRPGTSEPTVWLDFTVAAVDNMFLLSDIHLIGGTVAQIDIASFTNVHWQDLRFDNAGGYAVRLTPPITQSGSSFVLDRFTYDHHRSDNLGQGVLLVDNTSTSANVGTVTLRGGRIEVNNAWSGNKAIVSIKHGASAQSRSCAFHLVDLIYQDVVGMSGDGVIARETSNVTGSETVIINNCRLNSLANFQNGTWPAANVFPPATVIQSTGGVSFLGIGVGAGSRDWWLKPTSFALTDQATIATDASQADVFTVTLAGNRTLGQPTNGTDGQVVEYRILQSGGGNTLAYSAAFRFNTTFPSPTLSVGAGALDILRFSFNAAAGKWECIGIIKA